jgi:cytidylate kinase
MRELGAERQLHILDTNHAAATDEELDRIVDGTLQELGTHKDGVVVDSRLAWHWIPGSLKVILDLPNPIIAATRILADMDPIRAAREHIPEDPEAYALQLVERQRLESERYKKKYGVDPFNTANYDLVINTEKNDPADTVKLMMDAYRCMRLRRRN